MENQPETLQPQTELYSVFSKKTFGFVILAILIIIGGFYFYFQKEPSQTQTQENETMMSYKIVDPIVIEGDFIYTTTDCYPRSFYESSCPEGILKQLVVSDVRGKNMQVLKNITDDRYLVSPQGTYYYTYDASRFTVYKVTIFDANKHELFALPDFVSRNANPRFSGDEQDGGIVWSNDERFIAQITPSCIQGTSCEKEHLWTVGNNPRIAVYDVLKKKKVFDKELDNILEPSFDRGYYTDPHAVWSDQDNTLYSYNEKGIYVIRNLETTPQVTFLEGPCPGLAVRGNEFFCHSPMGSIFQGGAIDPKKSPYHTTLYKYVWNGEALSKPVQVTLPGALLEGEYAGKLYFIDTRYLIFYPSLGFRSIVDTETGKLETIDLPLPDEPTPRYMDLPVFFGTTDDDGPSTTDVPTRYRPAK